MRGWLRIAGCAGLVLLTGCGEREAGTGLRRVTLQTDWYAQPEHGGFYQALAKGYYAEAGLDVEILPGGLGLVGAAKVTSGQAQFAMHRADAIAQHRAEGLPLVLLMATLQHDPAGILLHAGSGIDSLAELDGVRVMAVPGSPWLAYLKSEYGVEPNIVPHDKGFARFLADESFVQQCMLTNEPVLARLQGVEVKTLPFAEAGFDPYHVVYAREDYVEANAETVRAFIEASMRGWRDYLTGDPAAAHALIQARNPGMDAELMRAVRAEILRGGYALGRGETEALGKIDSARLSELLADLERLGLLERAVTPEELTTALTVR